MVETDSIETAGSTVRGMHVSEVAEKARQTFETSLERIKPTAAAIIAKLRELSDQPGQVAVEFGIKLSAAAGVVLASSGLEANFKVTFDLEAGAKGNDALALRVTPFEVFEANQ